MRLLVIVLLLLLSACGSGPRDNTPEPTYADASSSAPPLPEFPLPAPKASTRANLPRALFGEVQRVGDVAARLENALGRAGYEDVGYYQVPGGFALVTETERIDNDGRPYPATQRWVFEASPLLTLEDAFTDFPGRLLDRLRNADPGRYRVLVFLTTTTPNTQSSEPVDFAAAETWTEEGGNFLPPSIADMPLTPGHAHSLLVYEFRRATVAAEPEFVDPTAITARGHLRATGILGVR